MVQTCFCRIFVFVLLLVLLVLVVVIVFVLLVLVVVVVVVALVLVVVLATQLIYIFAFLWTPKNRQIGCVFAYVWNTRSKQHRKYRCFLRFGSPQPLYLRCVLPLVAKITVFTVFLCQCLTVFYDAFASRAHQQIVKNLLKNGPKSTCKSIL